MRYLKQSFPITLVLLMTLIFAGCGAATSSNNTGNPTPTATAQANNPTPTQTLNPTPSPTAASSNILIHTATVVVGGNSKTILTNIQGLTLYYFTPDTPTTSACTGGCAGAWPPLLSTGAGTPTSSHSLSGTLTVQSTANGNQLEYNGHLLYTFSGDSAPGQTHGEGLFNKWFVATVDLK